MNAEHSDHHEILTLKMVYQNLMYQDAGPFSKARLTDELPKPPPEWVTDEKNTKK